jgi:hypothetical protein
MTNIYTLQDNVVFKSTDVKKNATVVWLAYVNGMKQTASIKDVLDLGEFQRTSTMSLMHFSQLQNNLHIANNLERPNDCVDKPYKVRPILYCIRARCQQGWPSLNLSDCMVLPTSKKKCELL